MKRRFINCIYGVHSQLKRDIRKRIDREIKLFMSNSNVPQEEYTTYVYGKENYKSARSLSLKNLVLIGDNPTPNGDALHRSKLEVWKYAMEEDGYDEIIFSDWDAVICCPIVKDIWKILGRKEIVQANLTFYRHRKVLHRSNDRGYQPNAGLVYIRDKSVPDRIIKACDYLTENNLNPDIASSDEIAMAYVMDEMTDGWELNGKGRTTYLSIFEPNISIIRNIALRFQWNRDYHIPNMDTICFIHHCAQRANNEMTTYDLLGTKKENLLL